MSTPGPRTVGLLPALGGGLTDLSRGGQLERLLAYDLRHYATAYERVFYFSYFAERLEDFTDDPTLRARVTVLPRRGGWPPRLYAFALPLLYAQRIRECEVLRVMQFTGVIPALIARALFHVPFVVTYGYHYARIARLAGSRVKPWALALLERVAFPAAAAVIVTSEEMEHTLAGRRHCPRVVVRFPNGVDTRAFAPRPDVGAAADGPPVVLYVGRLEPEKNLVRLIDALARVERPVRVRLVGDGSQRTVLERHAAARGVSAEFAGVVPHSRLPAEFARAAIFVLPSLSEGHPKALLEAMSCAVPCAVSDCAGTRAIAEPDRTALFFAPTDVEAMARAVGRLLADRELGRRLGAAARHAVSERFEADRLLRDEVEFVRSVGAHRDTAGRVAGRSRGTVGRKAFLQLLAQLVLGALGFVGSVVVARWMGPEPLGIIGYAVGLVGLFGAASDLGISQSHVQRVAVDSEAEIQRCAGTYLLLKSLLLLLTLALLGGYLLLSPAATAGPAGPAVLGLMVGAFFLTSLGQVALITFRARAQTAILGVAAVAGALLRFGWTLVVAVASLGVVALGAGYLAEAAATLGVGFLLFRRRYRISAPDPETLRGYIRYAIPLAVVVPLSMVEGYLDRVLLGHFASVRELGFYVAVQGLVALPYFFSKSAMTVFYPSVAQSWAADRPEELRRRFVQVTRALLLVSVPIAATLLVFADSLVTLLWGEEFRPAARILRVLALLPVLMALVRPYSNVLYATERQGALPAISGVNLLVLLLASFLLIPSELFGVSLFGLGGVGAAAAAVLVLATDGAQQAFVVHRGIGLGFPIRILPYLAAGLGMAVVSRWLASVWGEAWPLNEGVGLLVGVGAYLGILRGLRELRREDVRRLVDAVHPFRLMEYFRTEVRG